MKRNILLTPGPTQIPADLCEALARPIIHHRTPQFQQIIKDVIEGLQFVLQTKNEVYLLVASGSGGMEAAVCNLLSPGDKAVTVEGGKFGERWTELCDAYGVDADVIQVPWGQAVQPKQIREALAKNPDAKAVLVTLCETSTGVTPDIKGIAGVVKKTDAVLVVDGVSGAGIAELRTDAWGVDVVVSASHKGFMLPPGLAFIAVSDKAFKLIEAAKGPRYYFDLRKSKKAFAATDTPFTPAIGIIVAMHESLKKFKERGMDATFAHFAQLAEKTRAAAKALGLSLLAEESCISNVLTPINVPAGIDGAKLVKTMRDVHGVSVAGGQGHLKGKIIRIAHMGCVSDNDLETAFEVLEIVLKEMGYTSPGGEKAFQRVFQT